MRATPVLVPTHSPPSRSASSVLTPCTCTGDGPDAAPVEVEEILAVGAQPDAAGGIRHDREDEAAGRRVGHRIAGERAVAIPLQAVAHRADPHRAVAVGGDRRHRDLARAVRGQRLEPRVADADEAGALDGQPHVAFPILEQVADARAGQPVGAGDAAGAAVGPDVQHALAEVRSARRRRGDPRGS